MYARPSPPGGGGRASRHRHHTVRGRQPRIPRACTPTEPPRNRVENYPSRAHHPGPSTLALSTPRHIWPLTVQSRPTSVRPRCRCGSRRVSVSQVRTWPSGGDGLWRGIVPVPGALARPLSPSSRRCIICCILGVVRWPSVSWFLSLSCRICFIFALLIQFSLPVWVFFSRAPRSHPRPRSGRPVD